jgi:hypothetical protein
MHVHHTSISTSERLSRFYLYLKLCWFVAACQKKREKLGYEQPVEYSITICMS